MEVERIAFALAQMLRAGQLPPDDAYAWARYVAEALRPLRDKMTEGEPTVPTPVLRWMTVFVLLLLPIRAHAQTPPVLQAGQVIAVDIPDTGKMASGTTTVQRPEANLAFRYYIDGATTPVTAAKARPCTGTLPALTCFVTPPVLAEGTHSIRAEAIANPAEAGVANPGPGAALSFAVLLVTSPAVTTNPRLVP